MSKHKAPWRIETNSMGRVVTVCSAEGWPIARMVEDTDEDAAALIAAAPDLLKAPKAIIGDQPEDKYGYFAAHNAMDDDKRQAARAAIAKAEAAHG